LAAKENNRGGIKEWKEEDNSEKERKRGRRGVTAQRMGVNGSRSVFVRMSLGVGGSGVLQVVYRSLRSFWMAHSVSALFFS